jgi:sugar phosphate permease
MNSHKTSHRFHWAWMILGICFINVFISYSIRLGYTVIMPEMIKGLGLNRTESAWIYNAYLLAYICLAPLAGFLTDRQGGRRVIAVCCLILGLGAFCMGLVDRLWSACVFYALTGIGAAGMWTPVITTVQRWFAPRLRGTVLGIIGPSFGLGFAFTGLFFDRIMAAYSWRYPWFGLGIAALLMSLFSALLLRSDPKVEGYLPWGTKAELEPQPPVAEAITRPKINSSLVFKNRDFWLIGFSYAAVSYCLYGITTFMIDYAKNELHLANTGLLATIHGVAQVIGILTLLPLSDRWTRKRTLMISNAMIAVLVFGIFLLGKSWLNLALLIGMMALFYGATFPLYGACGGDYFPKEVMGTVIGLWTFMYGFGAMFANRIGGLIRDASGSYQQAFLIDAVLAVLGFLLISLVKKKTNISEG